MEITDTQGIQEVLISTGPVNKAIMENFDTLETKPIVRTPDSMEAVGTVEGLREEEEKLFAQMKLTPHGQEVMAGKEFSSVEPVIEENILKELIMNNDVELDFAPVEQKPLETPKSKGKIEMINDLRKMIEKNGFQVDDNELLAMFDKMTKKTLNKTILLDVNIKKVKEDQEIMIFPRKTAFFEKYKKEMTFDTKFFQQIISNFNDPKLFKGFGDEQHKLGIKFFDILSLEERDEGLFAKIKLNSLGLDAVQDRHYSYISPEWGDRVDTDGKLHKDVLWAVTLTNIPAFEGDIPQLQEQIKLQKGQDMDRNEINVRLSAIDARLSNKKLQEDQIVDIAAVAELREMLAQVLAAMDEIVQAKEVVEEVAEEAQAQLTKIKEEKRVETKTAYIEECVKLGRLHPSEVEDWSSHYDKDETFTRKILDKREAVSEDVQKSNSNTNEKYSLSKELEEIALDREIDISDPKVKKDFEEFMKEDK